MFRVFNCLTTEHDWRLVALAVVVCLLASLTAINLFHRARQMSGRARALWIGTAGFATGCGIWATHFIAMLAYDPGIAVTYSIGLTAISLVAAALITTIGLTVAVHLSSTWSAALGGGIVGGGVASMHYLGMAALQIPGHISWEIHLVALSVLLGIAFGTAALAVAVRRSDAQATVLAAVLLTLAIASHHFTAMGAVEIVPDPTRVIDTFSLSPTALAFALANAAIAILGLSLAGAFADRRLREQDRRLATAVNNMTQGLVMFDAQERMVVCNERYMEMYGLSPDIVKPGCSLGDIIRNRIESGSLDRDAAEYRSQLLEAMAKGNTIGWVVETTDGRAIQVVNRPISRGDWIGIHEDITERRRAEQELQRTKAFLNTVFENVPAMVAVKEIPSFRYVLINRVAESYYGVARGEMIGKTAADIFSPEAAAIIETHDRDAAQDGRELIFDVHPIAMPNGETRIVTTKRVPLAGANGNPQYLLTVVEDVTERKRAEARIEYLAHHDTLTDLPNRTAFNECLSSMLERAATADEGFAVLCIDLDRFKEVNDVFGHSTGDALLQEVARRLRATVGGAFVARPGGDEFIVIVGDGAEPARVAALAEALLASAAADVEIDGNHLRYGMSIGVAVYPTDGTDAKTLLANADAALYRAKQEGRGSIRFFASEMDKQLRDRRALQQDLRSAIERNQLRLLFQPQATIDGTVVGFEALLRWQHPTRGLVSPNDFIPIAEDSGIIIAIGEWVLREACQQAASWPRPLQVAVNLSPVQFKHGDLAGIVHKILFETGLAPSRLELEITEGVLIGDFSRAVSILRRIKALGVKIAMDDFGTGYSSLSYLQSFPFDKMKIDRTFVANLGRNPQSAAIIRAMIGLGRGLDLPIVAEGVETSEQLDFLVREQCHEVQGFLIGRPKPIEDFAEITGEAEFAEKRIALAG
jgi:diguanylate cyclase (GGDEF)-like protein/PAS domain S-box-containing protein